MKRKVPWSGASECASCGSSGEFTIMSRPEVVTIFGPREAAAMLTTGATHMCTDCDFQYFGATDRIDTSRRDFWDVQISADGRRLEVVDK